MIFPNAIYCLLVKRTWEFLFPHSREYATPPRHCDIHDHAEQQKNQQVSHAALHNDHILTAARSIAHSPIRDHLHHVIDVDHAVVRDVGGVGGVAVPVDDHLHQVIDVHHAVVRDIGTAGAGGQRRGGAGLAAARVGDDAVVSAVV